jgi:hypothetical protein
MPSALLDTEILRQLELLKLRAKRAFLGTRQGGHISLKKGHGIEFSDFRKYELGDDPRHIDWSVFARSERLYVKRFREEEDLSIGIILDSSASMHAAIYDKKWETAKKIALALSYIALMQQDRVLLNVPAQFEPNFVTGARTYHYLMNEVQKITGPCSVDFMQALKKSVLKLSYPGLLFIISDFLMPIEEQKKIFQELLAKNLDITAIQVLGPEDLNPSPDNENIIIIDSETKEEYKMHLNQEVRDSYSKLLNQHNFELQKFWINRGINFIKVNSKDSIEKIIVSNLTQAGILQ